MALPPEYVSYFAGDGRREGGLTVEPGWFQLWPPADVEHWNQAYHVSEFAPGFLGFGSNGGGELLAFDASGRIFMLPMVACQRMRRSQ
jgi:hypothetical protein